MAKFIPVQGVYVHREGKTIQAPIGEPFDFSDDEVADILALNPSAIREPINETPAPAKKAAAAPAPKGNDGL